MDSGKRDIEKRSDLEAVLAAFYEKAFQDDRLAHFFTTVVPLNMETHLPVITDFWEAVIFNRHTYRKNVMAVHQHISSMSPINAEHLDRWTELFTQTVDEYFEGEKAELMKQRALSIATLMKIKISSPSSNLL